MKKWLKEFKEFAVKGNVLDMAVGVVIGGAFGKIVTSVVSDIIMPLITGLFGGHDYTTLVWTIGESEVKYGMLIQNVVDFLIIAVSIFTFIKLINKLIPKKEPAEVEVVEEPKKPDDIVLLEEICATLKEIKENK